MQRPARRLLCIGLFEDSDMADSFIKRIELAIRRWYNTQVGSQGEPVIVDAPRQAISPAVVRRVLLLRQDRIGDVIVSTPIIKALRAQFPTARIDMVLSTNNIAVRQAVEQWVDGVHVFRKSIPSLLLLRRRLRRQRYDLVIDLMDNASSTSALLISGARAPFAIGVDKVNRGVYTHVVPLADQSTVHIVDRIARLTWPLGFAIGGEDIRLEFPLTDEQRRSAELIMCRSEGEMILAVNISGSDDHRMYPEAKMIEVLCLVREVCDENASSRVGMRIMSAPAHAQMAQRIGEVCGITVVESQSSYAQFAACIAASDMLLTPDTSAVHVAAAHGVASVVLFSQDARGLLPWTPYKAPCWPCVTSSGALEAIDPMEIVAAVKAMLQSTTNGNRPVA
ncbi:MAG: glycosyltransferase family 9 protein [Candidatus Kapabacteria bacterium]|nr:glycosyltransferase family 9 protein [Candidatus Kapabacteria bacterium]